MNDLLEFLKTIDTHIFVGTGIIMWYIARGIKKEIQKDVYELKASNLRHEGRIDKLYEIWCETQKEIKELCIEIKMNRNEK